MIILACYHDDGCNNKCVGMGGWMDGFFRCETVVVRIGSKTNMSSTTPEIFMSGALHGDERLGPNAVLEFIRLMCHMYGKHPIITYLVRQRRILVCCYQDGCKIHTLGDTVYLFRSQFIL